VFAATDVLWLRLDMWVFAGSGRIWVRQPPSALYRLDRWMQPSS